MRLRLVVATTGVHNLSAHHKVHLKLVLGTALLPFRRSLASVVDSVSSLRGRRRPLGACTSTMCVIPLW